MATPQLYYQPGGIAELIMQKCPQLKLPFNPTIWAPDPHTQSAMGSECRPVASCVLRSVHEDYTLSRGVRL